MSCNSEYPRTTIPERRFVQLLRSNPELTKQQLIRLTRARCYRILAELFTAALVKDEVLVWDKVFQLIETRSAVACRNVAYSSLVKCDPALFSIVSEAGDIFEGRYYGKTKPSNKCFARVSKFVAKYASWIEKKDISSFANYELSFWDKFEDKDDAGFDSEIMTKPALEACPQKSELFTTFLSASIYKTVQGLGYKTVDAWSFFVNPASYKQTTENLRCLVNLIEEDKIRLVLKDSLTYIKRMEKGGKNADSPDYRKAMESLCHFNQAIWYPIKDYISVFVVYIPHRPERRSRW